MSRQVMQIERGYKRWFTVGLTGRRGLPVLQLYVRRDDELRLRPVKVRLVLADGASGAIGDDAEVQVQVPANREAILVVIW